MNFRHTLVRDSTRQKSNHVLGKYVLCFLIVDDAHSTIVASCISNIGLVDVMYKGREGFGNLRKEKILALDYRVVRKKTSRGGQYSKEKHMAMYSIQSRSRI